MSRRTEQKAQYERPGLSQDEIEELREAFNLFDADGSGTIDAKELKTAMESLGYKDKNRMVFQMLENLSGGDELDFNAFLDLMTAKISDTDSREDIDKVFHLFTDGPTITIQDLQRVSRELGESLTSEELQEMVDRADLNGDGGIDASEFYAIMTKRVA